ncbi:hypothetical protein C9374_008378 [Naegleria lovaniensis]|uniref:Uncharacterized protein n=1 Tax=Naegleria lovaniensis TaxID=51637 RepID=A0AA88KG08_NAELO|nr:uncharacterized protein C9374_008378 [Naegleria lovaniensis]KAG2378235.1 hypothetical protein C9374_008378 [Naegleria lovaniensis]
MSTQQREDLVEEFKKIADRLKKRMFRKVPYDQISEQYANLSLHLQRNGQKHYTAISMLCAANAEKMNKTPLNAAFFYVYSGRIFSDQACSEKLIQYYTGEEFISEAIDAFREAIEIYDSKQIFSMCASLCYELAQTLKVLGKFSESSHYYTKCFFYSVKQGKLGEVDLDSTFVDNSNNLSLNRDTSHSMELNSLQNAIDCLLEIKDFEMAVLRLKIYVNILEERIDYFSNSDTTEHNVKLMEWRPIYKIFIRQWMDAQITLLIVLLLQKRKEEASEVFENLNSGEENSWIASEFPFFYENVLPLFAALIENCTDDNIDGIEQLLSQELQFCVTDQQQSLLEILRSAYENPLFMDILLKKEGAEEK